MAIPSKNSRKIVVGNETYRWTISPRNDYIVFIAEQEEFEGRRLEVYIHSDVDRYWSNFPKVSGLNLKIIKPKDAESIITQAIQNGWNPKEISTTMIFDLMENCNLSRTKSYS